MSTSTPVKTVQSVPATATKTAALTAEQFSAAAAAALAAAGVASTDVDPTKVTALAVRVTPQGASLAVTVTA